MSFLFPLLIALGCVMCSAPSAMAAAPDIGASADTPLPRLLHDTGLHSPGSPHTVRPGIAAFSPQYPLWSDGAEKRRWVYLPPGAYIDGSRPDAWEFPRGTKLWKEFAHDGRPVETRYIERLANGDWRFAAYVWNEAGTEAVIAPTAGVPALAVPGAPQGRYAVPSRADCLACHGSAAVPVLGLGALQLSPDRDPRAAGGRSRRADELDLPGLVARGWLRGLPAPLLEQPPRIPAVTPVERAALGYLHGNCAHCHNTSDHKVPLRLTLAQRVADAPTALHEVLRSAVAAFSRWRPSGMDSEAMIVAPGHPQQSMLALRMQSRNPQERMPPLGTTEPDLEGLALVRKWITSYLSNRKEISP